MRGTRGGLLGALAALLLAGCAAYPETYYYDDGYAGGDYYYERDQRRAGYGSDYGFSSGYDNSYWSPAYSRYYTSILYPPYGRSYDPWYTPGWHYGTGYAPGAGWRVGWSSYYGNPSWRSNWYSPFRHGSFYAGGGHGGYGGYGYGGWYDWYRQDSSRYWRDRERTLGRRGYEPSRRWGNDNRASEEAERIARRSGAAGYAPRDDEGGGNGGYDGRGRGGEPSAYDRRDDNNRRYGQPSRFGNPQAADRAPQDGQTYNSGRSGAADSGRVYGTRESGWIAPADGGATRRNRQPADQGEALNEARDDDADRVDETRRATRYQQVPSDAGTGMPSRSGYRRMEAPRQEYARPALGADDRGQPTRQQSPRYEAPEGAQMQRYQQPERYEQPQRYEQPSRRDAPRYESSAGEGSPRFEAAQRNDSPRHAAPAHSESPRYEAPARNDSPRSEQPTRSERSSSSSREIERLSREPE